MKNKRVDKQKNIDKVAVARLEHPLATIREIEEITGVSKSVVATADKQLGQIGTKYPEIERFIQGNLRILELGQNEIEERLSDPIKKKEINARDLNTLTDSAQRRYSLFAGDITDEKGGFKIEGINYIVPNVSNAQPDL